VNRNSPLVFVAPLVLALACAPELLPPGEYQFPADNDLQALTKQLEETRDQFLATMVQQGITPAFRPGVKFWEKSDGALSQLTDGAVIVLPRWADLPPEVQGVLIRWMSTERQAQELVDGAFHWFLFVHELGHLVQWSRGAVLDAWDKEFHANEVGVAYLRSQPQAVAKLRRLSQLLQFATQRMTPKLGRAYGRDSLKPSMVQQLPEPEDYGFFQMNQILDVLQGSEINPTIPFAFVERTQGGLDCALVGQRMARSCPNLQRPEQVCGATALRLSDLLNRDCLDIGKSFTDCYQTEPDFASCAPPDGSELPPLQGKCREIAMQLIACATKP
jgi:hypothetical protein